jgi:hypothetical protein
MGGELVELAAGFSRDTLCAVLPAPGERMAREGAALGFPTVVPCGDVDARRNGKSYSDDGDQAAILPGMEWAAKDFGVAPVDQTYQNRLGDDDDARDAQRSRQPHQVTPLHIGPCWRCALSLVVRVVVQLSGDRQPHANRTLPSPRGRLPTPNA